MQTFDINDQFNYQVKMIIKTGNYMVLPNGVLNGTERALCNLLAMDGVSLEKVSEAYGMSEKEAKEILKQVFIKYNAYYETFKNHISYDTTTTRRR